MIIGRRWVQECINEHCANTINIKLSEYKKGNGKYCSNACRVGSGTVYSENFIQQVQALCKTNTHAEIATILDVKKNNIDYIVALYKKRGKTFDKARCAIAAERIAALPPKEPKLPKPTKRKPKAVKIKKVKKPKVRYSKPRKGVIEKPMVIKNSSFNPDTQMYLKIDSKTQIVIFKKDYEAKAIKYNQYD